MDESQFDKTRRIIREHHGALAALGHWDSCESCQTQGVDSQCPELLAIFVQESRRVMMYTASLWDNTGDGTDDYVWCDDTVASLAASGWPGKLSKSQVGGIDNIEGKVDTRDMTKCTECGKEVDELAVFPGTICLSCYEKTPEARRPIAAEELTEMWGGKVRKERKS